MHTAPYFSAFGLLCIYHAARVINLRRKYKVSLGDGGVPELERMIRVFGNFVEYAPLGLVLLLALELVETPRWYLHLCGGSLLAGRMLHSLALTRTKQMPNPGRIAGMVLTFSSLLLSSIGIMAFSILQRI